MEPKNGSDSAQELVETVIEALVQHYRDPVHEEEDERRAAKDNDHNVEVPPVLAFQLRRLLEFVAAVDSSSDCLSTSTSRVRDAWAHLLQSYAARIRPTVFTEEGPTKVAVVLHYQRLIRLFLKHNEDVLLRASLLDFSDADDQATIGQFNHMHELAVERVANDVTLATALEVRRRMGASRIRRRTKGNADFGSSPSNDGTNDNDDDVDDDDVVDLTATFRIVAALVRLMTSVGRVAMAHRASNTSTAITATIRNDDSINDWDRIELRCAITILSFQWDPTCMLGIAPCPTNAKNSVSVDSLHHLPMTLAPKDRDEFYKFTVGHAIDWSLLLELKGSIGSVSHKEGNGGPLSELRSAVREFELHGGGFEGSPSSATTEAGEVLTMRRWSSETVSKAVRAHFFGRDMLVEPAESMVPTHRTRLHLGTTVRYEPDPDVTQKSHLKVPSRVAAALQFMSVLNADQLTEAVWNELLPILYELLSASSYALNGWGAVALYRLVLLHDHTNDSFLVSEPCETSVQNLLLMLHTVAKTCREGPVLAVVGKAYCLLLTILNVRQPASAAQQRRTASHHWLTVLYQNETRAITHPTLILGLLTGVIHILHDQVTSADIDNADGLEVGRLGLSALLPLLAQDDDVYSALGSVQNESTIDVRGAIRLAALIALNNLMIAAYPIVPRHAGKILSHLLRACAETQPSSMPTIEDGAAVPQEVALHVASSALILSQEKGDNFLLSLENSLEKDDDSCSASFRELLAEVRRGAQALRPQRTPIELPTTKVQGLIQVL